MVHFQQEVQVVSSFRSSEGVIFVYNQVNGRFHMNQFAKYSGSVRSRSDFHELKLASAPDRSEINGMTAILTCVQGEIKAVQSVANQCIDAPQTSVGNLGIDWGESNRWIAKINGLVTTLKPIILLL